MFEAGVGLFAPLSESGRHRLFANFTGGIGILDQELKNPAAGVVFDESDSTLTVDANLGYSYVFNQSASAHVRYRFLTIQVPSPITVVDVSDNWLIFHGPEIGFTWRF